MSVGVLPVSGVGQVPGITDGIGNLHETLKDLPGVTSLLYRWRKWHEWYHWRTPRELFYAKLLAQFDYIIMVGHSRGGKFCVDTDRDLAKLHRRTDCLFLADAWSPDGELTISPNVDTLWTVRKEAGKPAAAKIIVPDGSPTNWATNLWVDAGHNAVDSNGDLHAAVVAACLAAVDMGGA